LQRLHHELNLANPTRAELHVSIKILVADDVPLDASFDRGDLIEQLGVAVFG
jgi:hypothetical protein